MAEARDLLPTVRDTLWVAGGMALAFVTWACFELGLNFATTALLYLIVIALPSLLDSFISSAVFSVVAVGNRPGGSPASFR